MVPWKRPRVGRRVRHAHGWMDPPRYAPPRRESEQALPAATEAPEVDAPGQGWSIKNGELVDAATGERPAPLPEGVSAQDAMLRIAKHLPSHKVAAMQQTLAAVTDHLAIQKEPALADLIERGADLVALARLACSDDTNQRAQLSAKLTELGLKTFGARKRAEGALRGDAAAAAVAAARAAEEPPSSPAADHEEDTTRRRPPPPTAEEVMARRAQSQQRFEANVLQGYVGEAAARGASASSSDQSTPAAGYLPDGEDDAVERSAGRLLFEASLQGDEDVVRRLLLGSDERGALFSWVNKWGESALHIAADRGHESIVKSLLHSNADMNARNRWNATPLIAASYWGHAGAVEALLLAGADRRVVADNGKTAMGVARQAEHSNCQRLLKTAPWREGEAPKRESDDEDEEHANAEPLTSAMPIDMVRWCEECLDVMVHGGSKHMSLLHWLWTLPTCEDADIQGYLGMYLGRIPNLGIFAHEFASRKYDWRVAKRREAEGKEALFAADREAIAAGSRDRGCVADGSFERVFTERTLGLLLRESHSRIHVKGAMTNSAAAKRAIPIGVLLDSVNGEPVGCRPLKEVQRLISRAERPVRLVFSAPAAKEDKYPMPEGRPLTPPTTTMEGDSAAASSAAEEAMPRGAKILVRASLALVGTQVSLSLSVGMRQPRRQRRAAAAVAAASRSCAPVLCFDVGSFAQMMSEGECAALSRQLTQIYGYNRACDSPFTLAFAGLASARPVLRALETHGYSQWVLTRENGPPWEAFERSALIYLCAEADEPLTADMVQPGSVLVVGGLVDYADGHAGGSRVGAALAVAREQGVRTARLPIEPYVVVRKPSLTCLAVVQILSNFAASRDWGAAVREAPAMSAAPLRKYVRWKTTDAPALPVPSISE